MTGLAQRSIAILATGNELVEGDVVNTNAARIAQRLTESGFLVNEHRVVVDRQSSIVRAIESLAEYHSVIITIGGLGPTCDDITRFAVAEFGEADCVLDDACWQQLIARFEKHQLAIPALNKQQCLFPASAMRLPNPHGSAAGFEWKANGVVFFVLPGPPNECLSMLDNDVIPRLHALSLAATTHRYSALLMGIGEGQLASQLEPIMAACPKVDLGYRVCFPYLEIKLQADSADDLSHAKAAVWPYMCDFLVSEKNAVASMQLKQWLCDHAMEVGVDDQATHGHWQALLTTPDTLPRLNFSERGMAMHVKATGLEPYWTHCPVGELITLTLDCCLLRHEFSHSKQFTMRGERTLQAVLEWLCWQLLLNLQEVIES